LSDADFPRVIRQSGSVGSKWKSFGVVGVDGLRALSASILAPSSCSLGLWVESQ
jgi:hypothetical protein